ncbi:LOW QUALITY PROTEIN: pleiotropic drug resistance protein 3-like [Ziziphus jujuba]|uniref:LOW QUALITY PROTEIN: pleiotropic drug resistance protein 3-like n=1 Tax=Ziziphus jujuba TaxID=326968 RepID=A0ABM4A707_ZIZJJ|nr:LOW QUALITY PROTEIN: pleiotropic drug resistance protein 3-like [Ziziphus jujuba]
MEMESAEINRRRINESSFHIHASSFRSSTSTKENDDGDDEVELQWAAIERLPTFERIRSSLFDNEHLNGSKEKEGKSVIDVTKLGAQQRHIFIEKLLKDIEQDNRRLLQKLKERIDSVGVELPTVEVRYKNLFVEAECEIVEGKTLPTLWNTLKNIICGMTQITGCKSQVKKLEILKDVSGIIKPSRLTLLLGPPGCGKTTLLQSLAGILNHSLKVTGEITYNGFKFSEFVPQKTSAYISQYDLHIPEMTVRETLDFSARCQGIGSRADMMKEVSRREKQVGIVPEPDIDTYMKAISVEGLKRTLLTDYIIKILGLDTCADTIVGNAMKRGISGGQKKRLTTAEMIIGPTRALFMDEISNGLDSSTTFQIVSCLQQLTHITESTILVSLLQPAPETFDLFDDVILMAEGKIAYHGPRHNALEFFEHCGFRCPLRKGIADFLQEVVSKKDQEKYWYHKDQPYSYIEVDKIANMFNDFHVGKKLSEELSKPFNKSEYHKNALSFNIYKLKKWELLRACTAREWLLMKRNSFVHVFKTVQLVITAVVTMTVFLRTRMNIDMVGANFYLGSLFYALIRLMCNGIAEISMTASRLGIFYKQRDFYFYPAWAYSIPTAILKIPLSLLDAFLWTAVTYYVIGYSPEIERFFKLFLLLFLVHQVAVSLFRLIASMARNPSVASTCGLFTVGVIFVFGGFIIRKTSLPAWLQWGFWVCPLAYAEIGVSVNEFLAPRWQKMSSSNITVGQQVLKNRGLDFSDYFYWISIGALVGFWIVFNIAFTCALSYINAPGRSRTKISHRSLSNMKGTEDFTGLVTQTAIAESKRTSENPIGLVLPFEPVTISFENVQYFVDTPKKLRDQGFPHKRLQLLHDITGAFRPGILTALMGVSGAGKTTLMDVLSGRKTGGIIKGDIRIEGYPKVQKAYARISAYCEQFDVHSPNITVGESVTYSAWLRLPAEIDRRTRSEFVEEVLQMIELDELKDELVGVTGVSGISNEQRKRLTIAVELVSNPSIIFMDEPTSGLDARAAAIVMRVVKNIVSTNRTVVCTIHQPSINIFDSFDELILLKRGGQIIYSGELGQNSSKLIEYFEGVSGVPKIKENYNPATWMLEVTNPSVEAQLGVDFAVLYKESDLHWKSNELVKELSSPRGSKAIQFSTRFPQNGWDQFGACLWKQHLSYWRNPQYNLVRLIFIAVSSLLFGVLLWQKGQRIDGEQDLYNILGSMYIFVQFMGIGNCSSVLPLIASERTIVYRERFAGMYSPWAYAFSQVIIEIPYVFLQAFLFLIITYPVINFYWSLYKMCWYFYTTFCTFLYFNYLDLLIASLTPTLEMATVVAAFSYTLLNLFSGFLIPGPVSQIFSNLLFTWFKIQVICLNQVYSLYLQKIPKWWVWAYWSCPTSWSLKGLLTSQYGDSKKQITIYGEKQAIDAFLKSYYGYDYDDLGIVAFVLLAYALVFACGFSYATAKLNFQKR